MDKLQRTVLWQNLKQPGTEYCRLMSHDYGWRLTGTTVLVFDDNPLQAQYLVACNHLWQTRTVQISANTGADEQSLHLIVDEKNRWWLQQEDNVIELIRLRGCLDVDLGITPATNTLPIRRNPLAIGDSVSLKAAWIQFPTLDIETLSQKYTRLTEHRYRYESNDGQFSTEIDVDEMGLVKHYPNGWQRVAVQAVGELLYPNLGQE